jgi:hypothetical protein
MRVTQCLPHWRVVWFQTTWLPSSYPPPPFFFTLLACSHCIKMQSCRQGGLIYSRTLTSADILYTGTFYSVALASHLHESIILSTSYRFKEQFITFQSAESSHFPMMIHHIRASESTQSTQPTPSICWFFYLLITPIEIYNMEERYSISWCFYLCLH